LLGQLSKKRNITNKEILGRKSFWGDDRRRELPLHLSICGAWGPALGCGICFCGKIFNTNLKSR
jgi:hypothetical protein